MPEMRIWNFMKEITSTEDSENHMDEDDTEE